MTIPAWIEVGLHDDNVVVILDDSSRLLTEDEALALAIVLLGNIIQLRKNRRQK